MPPEDIGSSFYPELNPYSSRDPDTLESHMEQIGAAAAGKDALSVFQMQRETQREKKQFFFFWLSSTFSALYTGQLPPESVCRDRKHSWTGSRKPLKCRNKRLNPTSICIDV